MSTGARSGIDTVRKFYELMGQDRFEEASSFLAPDVVVRETPICHLAATIMASPATPNLSNA